MKISRLLQDGRGILASDESVETCGNRFEQYGIENTPEMRRKWRELLFTTPEIEKFISGVILFEETIKQSTEEGESFVDLLNSKEILIGIKADQKTEPFADSSEELVTRGLDNLSQRLSEYKDLGASFSKWRAVFQVGENLPSRTAVAENARRMATFALASQKNGMTPILEPEVLLKGGHTLADCKRVIEAVLKEVFSEAESAGVDFSDLLLKSSMALSGDESGEIKNNSDIADATLQAFLSTVPKEIQGIVFLSGGQKSEDAFARLRAIVSLAKEKNLPWRISFSFSRALQDSAMRIWSGKDQNYERAQEEFRKNMISASNALK